ncbi:flavin reductase family protein [Aquabacter spiritensis]|uniref:Flavin reductase n=1 Tax=Aquabacter spiritensis TaxID=933073 RepID=A0A4R3M024_9HYPH|nr:flavin reductase family protein [Aquabacter spiritensis]TCT05509.1 flavin reductase [Aquabacter spiritensis]
MVDSEAYKQGMRRLAAGVTIITTIEDGRPHGFVATAVSSVAAEPNATLLVCVNRSAHSHGVIHRTGIFCVNVLSHEDMETARRFSASHLREARFADQAWDRLATGAPALPSALASFDCTVIAAMEVHSHTVFIGEVQHLSMRDIKTPPLLYFNGRFEALPAAG